MAKKSRKRSRRQATRPEALEALTVKLPVWLKWDVEEFGRQHALDRDGAIRYLLATRLQQIKRENVTAQGHSTHGQPLQIINHSPMGGNAAQRSGMA
jgi:hypothetical protein